MHPVFYRSRCLVVMLVAVVGCNNQPTKPAPPIVAASAPEDNSNQPMLPHPEYQNWSRFPVNSLIVRKRTVSNENGEVTVTTKMWLAEKSDKHVSVGTQVNVQRPGEGLEVNPSNVVDYPAEFQLPKGMEKERFYLPSIKAKKVADEPIKILEKEFTAEVYEWEESNETGPMTVKLWRSLDVPGRIIKQEMLTKSSKTQTLEDLVELDLSGNAKIKNAGQ